MPDDKLPEASTAQAEPNLELAELVIGEPFAKTGGCDLVDKGEKSPGCIATIKCDCGQAFKVNLLADGFKICPRCQTQYTHVLLVCDAEDSEMVTDFLADVMQANGLEPARTGNPGDDDENGDELGDDDAPEDDDESDGAGDDE